MREIEPTTRFRRDFKRVKKGAHGRHIDLWLKEIIALLAADEILPPHYRDHALTGNWRDHRDCHIRPDLVLIYRKIGEDTLQLVRMGSHSELEL